MGRISAILQTIQREILTNCIERVIRKAEMRDEYSSLCRAIRQELQKMDSPNMGEVRKALDKELHELLRDGVVSPGHLHKLGGKELELYVWYVFEDMGLKVELKECDESKWGVRE